MVLLIIILICSGLNCVDWDDFKTKKKQKYMTKQQLIDQYVARIATATAMLRDLEKDGTDVEQHKRVAIKRSCYRTFLSELERLEENVDTSKY